MPDLVSYQINGPCVLIVWIAIPPHSVKNKDTFLKAIHHASRIALPLTAHIAHLKRWVSAHARYSLSAVFTSIWKTENRREYLGVDRKKL